MQELCIEVFNLLCCQENLTFPFLVAGALFIGGDGSSKKAVVKQAKPEKRKVC